MRKETSFRLNTLLLKYDEALDAHIKFQGEKLNNFSNINQYAAAWRALRELTNKRAHNNYQDLDAWFLLFTAFLYKTVPRLH